MCTLPPPPIQARFEISATLKPETQLSGKKFAKLPQLPASLRGAKVRPEESLPASPTIFPPNHPRAQLERSVRIYITSNALSASEIRAQLQASNLFERIDVRVPSENPRFQYSALDELSNHTVTDNHRWQWALPMVKAPEAWDLTTGRALIASVDGGIKLGHPDMQANARAQISARNAVNFDPDPEELRHTDWRPNELEDATSGDVRHGMHVNSIMAAAWQSKASGAPLTGSGIVGICPSCSLGTVRIFPGGNQSPFAYAELMRWMGRAAGSTAVNFSFSAGALFSDQLADSAKADTVIVGAAGNFAGNLANGAQVQYPANWVGSNGHQAFAVGASDFDDKRWDETRIMNLPLGKRHPGIGGDKIAFRCVEIDAKECGSVAAARVDLLAPGVQILAAIDRPYSPMGFLFASHKLNFNGNQAPWLTANLKHQPPGGVDIGNAGSFRTQIAFPTVPNNAVTTISTADVLGGSFTFPTETVATTVVKVGPIVRNQGLPAQFNQWGPLTGTSMAAPMVTATVGLMRSVNPLVSAASIMAALKSSPNAIQEHQPLFVSNTYKRLNVFDAVKKTLGIVAGQQQQNRLIPMFSMRATVAETFSLDPEAPSLEIEKDTPSSTQNINSWLFTTSVQTAQAALNGDYLFTSGKDSNDDFGTQLRTTFRAGHTFGTGGVLPSYRFPYYTPESGATPQDRYPSASFYLLATETKPAWLTTLDASANLVPLWRLSTKCFQIRKFTYAVDSTEITNLTTQGVSGGDTAATCLDASNITGRQFWRDQIEGYVIDRLVTGAVPLYRVLNPGTLQATYALSLSNSAPNSEFPGFGSAVLLGYVIPTEVQAINGLLTLRDTDSDGLEDQFERITGLNEQTADSDCDGSDDGVEFPLAGVSPSDPNLSASCADRRANVVRQSAATVEVIMSNAGASAASNVVYEVIGSVPVGNTFPAITSITVPTECIEIFVRRPGEWAVYHCTFANMASGFSRKVEFKMVTGASPAVSANFTGTVTSLGVPISDPSIVNNTQSASYSF